MGPVHRTGALSASGATAVLNRVMVRRTVAGKEGGREHFPHRDDVGVRGFGPTRAAAFENAARGLMAVVADPALIAAKETVHITCTAPHDELLLVDWLNALIFEIATRHMLFTDFHVRLQGKTLKAEAVGEAVDITRHEPAVEVKGATYTELNFYRGGDGQWAAQCVVDV
jgi:SHS2 domain-containing protein